MQSSTRAEVERASSYMGPLQAMPCLVTQAALLTLISQSDRVVWGR